MAQEHHRGEFQTRAFLVAPSMGLIVLIMDIQAVKLVSEKQTS